MAYRAEVVDVVARRLLPADPEEEKLRPLIVGAPNPNAQGPVVQQPPEVGLPVFLYCGRVQVPVRGVEDVWQLVAHAVGPDKLQAEGGKVEAEQAALAAAVPCVFSTYVCVHYIVPWYINTIHELHEVYMIYI